MPEGKKLYFRFYDPRALEVFLGASTPRERARFFGPIHAFGIPRPGDGAVLVGRAPGTPAAHASSMPKISRAQMDAFSRMMEEVFIDQLVAHIRKNHRLATLWLSREKLRGKIVAGVARGRSYGLTWESSLSAFVAIMFTVAPNFDEHPAIQRVLTDEGVKPDERLDEALKREASRRRDPKAWYRKPVRAV